MYNFFIIVFLLCILFFAIVVITTKNPIFSTLALIASFLAACLVLIYVEVYFFAFLYTIIYVGAIAVLFLFVIMFIDIDFFSLNKQEFYFAPILLFCLTIILFYFIILYLTGNFLVFFDQYIDLNFFYSEWSNYIFIDEIFIENIAKLLYINFANSFLLLGLLLLIAIIGSILITLRLNTVNTKNISKRILKKDLNYGIEIVNFKQQKTKYQVLRKTITNHFN